MIPDREFKIIIKHTPLVSIDFIVQSHNKVLLGKRVNKPAQNYYFTMGGIVKKNEKFQDAMKRIAQNELGIELCQKPKYIGVFEHFYDDSIFESVSTHYVNHGYLLEMKEKLVNLPIEQHNNYKWFSVEELLQSNEVHQYVKDYFTKGEI
ncbi:GDP-mannose mannosyl hydrolase [Sulfurimonas marina]|uniref:GDP-mannose mannosyl hydrolase n=1 Tax=Sulfurimonas marina TaxID=2590551 RepID=A0A7M1AVK3_9BACT|nr:GDP-mannose mannosyl hydrolase [Sulfurimonas marina]QOP41467.1 GDP-mannose mannosyl hydrolase [Sulfurimonas marina]